jgi:CubicO group peptidase (beta-lactamase class C family)
VVAVAASRDKILSITPVGYEDLAAQKPMEANSLFWIASITKPVTAVAVMMLVEQDKIGLDDPVSKYLPEFQNMMVAPPPGSTQPVPAQSPLLVRQLLDHTSGLGFSTGIEKPALDDLPLAQAVQSYAKAQLRFQPGTAEFYSNEGFNTAGRLIEIVSGEPYEKFLDERIFQPLGMTDATFWPSDEQLTRLAKTYAPVTMNGLATLVEKPFTHQLTYPLNNRQNRYPFPAGGLFATAPDIARFGQMLARGGTFDGKYYLSPATIAEMSQDQTGALARRVGLGFEDIAPGRYGKSGASNTHLTIYPGPGLVAVFCPQQNGPLPGSMRADFEKQALREMPPGGK